MMLREGFLVQQQRFLRSLGPCQASSPCLGQRQRSSRNLGLRTLSKRKDRGGYDSTDHSSLLQQPLLSLAKQQNSERIQEIPTLLKAPALATWLEDFGSANGEAGLQVFRGVIMLHLIMKHGPLSALVDLLILRLSELKDGFLPEEAAVLLGRTPLHLDVHYCCDSSVIKRLVNGAVSVVPAVTKDASGCLPLHWACENPQECKLNESFRTCGSRSKNCDNMMVIIKILTKVYPHAAAVKDFDGGTPLNLAMENSADQNAVLVLDQAKQRLHLHPPGPEMGPRANWI